MRNKGRYVKAMVLLAVFSMNTVMSFACSLSSFVHSFHHNAASVQQAGLHHHEHGEAGHHHGQVPAESDDCCSADIVQVEMADKSPGRSIQLPLPLATGSFVQPYSYTFYKPTAFAGELFADPWRWRPPMTIQDLRIVMQSFQI